MTKLFLSLSFSLIGVSALASPPILSAACSDTVQTAAGQFAMMWTLPDGTTFGEIAKIYPPLNYGPNTYKVMVVNLGNQQLNVAVKIDQNCDVNEEPTRAE